MLYRPETNRCNSCIVENHRGWMVPCIPDSNDVQIIWGYLNVPQEDIEKFYKLPEKSSAHPYWLEIGGWSNAEEYLSL